MLTAGPDTIRLQYQATATAAPLQTFEVSSEMTGRLATLLVNDGDTVHAGQLLATVIPERALSPEDAVTAARLSAEAQLEAALATLTLATQQHDRVQALSQSQGLPREELERAQSQLLSARAQVKGAEAAILSARASASVRDSEAAKTRIRAPADGIVTSIHTRPGGIVYPTTFGGEAGRILTLSSLRGGKVTLNLPERYALSLDAHDSVSATLWQDPSAQYDVTLLSNYARSDGGGFDATFAIRQRTHVLRYGSTLRLTLLVERTVAERTVPLHVLHLDPDDPERFGLFVLENGHAVFTPVRVLLWGDNRVALDPASLPTSAAILTGASAPLYHGQSIIVVK